MNFSIVISEYDNTNIICFEVQSHTLNSSRELNHFSCLYLSKSENSCNTISERNDCTEFFEVVLH